MWSPCVAPPSSPRCGLPLCLLSRGPQAIFASRNLGDLCARVSGLGISKALGQKWGLYKIENQAVQASNTFQHHLYKIENQAALENTNIPQLSKKNSTKSCPSNMMFFFVFFCCFFLFFIFFFPSSDFYFVEEVRVQSGTPAPARERVAVRYFVEEMITGIT